MRPLLGIVALVIVAISLSLFASHLHPGGDLPPQEQQAEKDKAAEEAAKEKHQQRKDAVDHSPGAFDKVATNAIHVTLVFEGKAPIQIELYPAAAPQTVAHISALIRQGFYTGIKVHRLEDGSHGLKLIQMGDPESAKLDPAAFSTKDIGSHGSTLGTVPLEAKLPHLKYTIGLARGAQEDSGDSQFYINTETNSNLDGEYCIFGRLTGGMDVLPTVKLGDVIKSFSVD